MENNKEHRLLEPVQRIRESWARVEEEATPEFLFFQTEADPETIRKHSLVDNGHPILSTPLSRHQITTPYAPFPELLRTLHPSAAQANTLGSVSPLETVYPLHRPLIRNLLNGVPVFREDLLLAEEIPYERRQLLQSLSGLVQQTAQAEPFIQIVEGLENAGKSTLDLIRQLLQAKGPFPALFIFLFEDRKHQPEEWMAHHWESFRAGIEERIIRFNKTPPLPTPEILKKNDDPETIIRICLDSLNLFAFEECMHHALTLYERIQVGKITLTGEELFSLLTTLGEVHVLCNDIDAALLYYNVLLNHIQEHPETGSFSDVYRSLVSIYISRGNRQTAARYLEQGTRLAAEEDDPEKTYNLMIVRFRYLERFTPVSYTDLNRLQGHLAKTIATGKSLKKDNSVTWLLEKFAFQAISLESDRDAPQGIYKEAIALAEKTRNRYRLAALHGGMGVYFSIQNNPKRAFRSYTRSLRLKLSIKESREAAKSYNSIGYLCYLAGDYGKAVQYYSRAVDLLKEMMDFNEVTMTLFNMVQAFFYAQNHTLAKEYSELVIRITGLLKMKSLPMSSLSEVYALAALTALKCGDRKACNQYFSQVNRSSSGNDEYYYQLLRAQLHREDHEYGASEAAFEKIHDSLRDRNKPFFIKNYSIYFSIPYYYEYAGMLLEAGKPGKARKMIRLGLAACEKTGHHFYKALLQSATEGSAKNTPGPDLPDSPVDTSFLLTLARQQSRFLRQESNLNRLHKKINEINFLNNLQSILSRSTERDALIRKVMEFIHHNLLIEVSVVVLKRDAAWHPVYASRPERSLPFRINRLRARLVENDPEILVPDLSLDGRFPFLQGKASSLMCAGLKSGEALEGVVICINIEKGLTFRQDDFRILTIVTQQLSSALERLSLIEQLREMDRVKTRFFKNVSHETKTPLTLISNYLEQYIRKHGETEELSVIRQNIFKLQRDMVNFLDSEKLKSGTIFYDHSQTVNLTDLLEKKGVLFSEIAANKTIHISFDLLQTVYIKADPFAIDRVCNNILDNAIKYTPKGGSVHIQLSTTDHLALLEISDTGIGISNGQLNSIFELYHQISHRKRNLQGIGMGLYIVKKVIDSLGGSITVESSEGKGSLFRIQLPLSKETPPIETEGWSSPPSPLLEGMPTGTTDYQPSRGTILLVEDNRSLSALMLSNLGRRFNCYHAINGVEALKKLNEIPRPGVIVSDVMMDEMDGFAFFEHLRRDPSLRDIPFIFLSARSDIEDRMQGLLQGAIDYIAKPFRIEELEAKIDAILRLDTLRRYAADNEKMAAIGRLTAGISHEIFNPLSAIIGPLEYLEERFAALDQERKERQPAGGGETTNPDGKRATIITAFDHINNSVLRIENIIKSLKTLYYHSPMEKGTINLHNIVSSIILLQEGKTRGAITFDNTIPEGCVITGNHEVLTRILVNLISNAVDAIQEGGEKGTIRISTEKTASETTIRIRDNGIGIPHDQLKSIFDLFYTTKDPGKGTGLGLHLVRELCLRMGWSVSVNSEENEWTEFCLSIPNDPTPNQTSAG